MKHMKSLMTLWMMTLFLTATAGADTPRYYRLTIIHTNDMHTNLLPFKPDPPRDAAGNPIPNLPDTGTVGGAARRAAVIEQIRRETRNPLLLTDSGDTIVYWGRNDILANHYHGTPVIDAMNRMRYDVMEPGNHEFQWTYADTERAREQAAFPWVCANLVDPQGKLVFPPYVIRELDGVRVGIMGLITPTAVRFPAAKERNFQVLDPIETAKKVVPELQSEADIIIVLSHLGYGTDLKLALVPGIDAVIGGHSHTRITPPRMVRHGDASAFDLNATAIVQAHVRGAELGRLDLVFRKDAAGKYQLMSVKGQLITLKEGMAEDQDIRKMIDKYLKAVPVKK